VTITFSSQASYHLPAFLARLSETSALGKTGSFPLTHEEHGLPLGKNNGQQYHPRRRRAVGLPLIGSASAKLAQLAA
jgi:hypothetical protein